MTETEQDSKERKEKWVIKERTGKPPQILMERKGNESL